VPNGTLITRRKGNLLISGNSCVAFSSDNAQWASTAAAGGTPSETNHGWVYEHGRKVENGWPADSGMAFGDAFDPMRKGVPLESEEAYVPDPSKDYSNLDAEATNTPVAQDLPFFVAQGQFLETVCAALAAGHGVAAAVGWRQAFFGPVQGVLPAGAPANSVVGGHGIFCWGRVPGYTVWSNQWGQGWAADAASSGLPDMRPGDFAIPDAYLTTDPIWWEGHVILSSFVAPQPQPQPNLSVDPTKPIGGLLAAAMANPTYQPAAAAVARRLIDYAFMHPDGISTFAQALSLVDWVLDGEQHAAQAIQQELAAGWLVWLRSKGAA
jgi:hypothetical protein